MDVVIKIEDTARYKGTEFIVYFFTLLEAVGIYVGINEGIACDIAEPVGKSELCKNTVLQEGIK